MWDQIERPQWVVRKAIKNLSISWGLVSMTCNPYNTSEGPHISVCSTVGAKECFRTPQCLATHVVWSSMTFCKSVPWVKGENNWGEGVSNKNWPRLSVLERRKTDVVMKPSPSNRFPTESSEGRRDVCVSARNWEIKDLRSVGDNKILLGLISKMEKRPVQDKKLST